MDLAGAVLIQRAEVGAGRIVDVRVTAGRIAEMSPRLAANAGERIIDARKSALLPGLHDHHLHLPALAASMMSLRCGPPAVHSADELAIALSASDARPEWRDQWLRGVGYHQSVAGDIDRDWLDRHTGLRPVRIQHRSGRLWIFNSRALEHLHASGDTAPLERLNGRLTGRLYDGDRWLRDRVAPQWLNLGPASVQLASRGVTGLTEATPGNDIGSWRQYKRAQGCGELLQNILLMGNSTLANAPETEGIRIGPLKIHLHETLLPDFETLVSGVRESHAAGRPVAIHCVTSGELAFALEVLRDAHPLPGDRIEHASITPAELLPVLGELGLCVVTQPHFILERGDAYRREVAACDRDSLYRLRSFLDAGIPLVGSSDAPFGDTDPWRAMQSAVERKTVSGVPLGPDEALTPEQAVALYCRSSCAPGSSARRIALGAPADLCLLDRSWELARSALSDVQVRFTMRGGKAIWDPGVGASDDTQAMRKYPSRSMT